MRSDLPPPLVDTDGRLVSPSAASDMDEAVLRALVPQGPDLAFTVRTPVHEYVELRLFRREIRRRAHVQAAFRFAAIAALAVVFAFTFVRSVMENQSQAGFSPKSVAAR
jgi:hypothetical protein